MLEYLYKALKKGGLSVEGSLVRTSKGYEIIDLEGISYEIRPETICQYTGKNDRKGKRIFSDDIVRSFGEGDFASLFEDFIVKWDEDKCRYIAIDERGRTEEFDTFFAEHCEVTFNLHNPTKVMFGGTALVDLTKDEKLMALIEKHKPKEGER